MTDHEVTLLAVGIPAAIAAVSSVTTAWIATRVRRDTREINRAVNDKPAGAQTISDQVHELHAVTIPHLSGEPTEGR